MFVNGEWIEIGNAKIGDKIRTLNGDELIETIEWIDEKSKVFNLEVENNHNFFAERYLAHNKQAGGSIGYM